MTKVLSNAVLAISPFPLSLQMVKANWTEDYYTNGGCSPGFERLPSPSESSSGLLLRRRRVPFVPFALKNSSGATLCFCTQTRMSGSHFGPSRTRHQSGSEEVKWRCVEPGETVPFTFEERAKLRHVNSHDMKIHQIVVRVGDWQEVSPVSVDRVGTYFRRAEPMPRSAMDYGAEMPPAR